ncbi:hypothetical protein FJZ28_03860 [Candidatus Peregrinibacteria bacterium]|nr:hypothetical protein [Candidatus Peregrinibacteria bacterium]
MKRLIVSTAFGLLLAGCGGSGILTYNVRFDTTDKVRMTDLTQAAQKVMERRLARLNGGLMDFDIEYVEASNTTTITAEVDPAAVAEALNEEMTAPFSMEIRIGVPEAQEGDITVEGQGIFRATGVAGTDIDWVLAGSDEDALKKGNVIIGFTDEGVEKMQKLFKEFDGKPMGIFARGRLAAKIQLDKQKIERTISIRGLPSREIADVFADDMNVGLHMTFERVK